MMREKRSRTWSVLQVRSNTIATARTKYQPVAVTWMAFGTELHQPHLLQRVQFASSSAAK